MPKNRKYAWTERDAMVVGWLYYQLLYIEWFYPNRLIHAFRHNGMVYVRYRCEDEEDRNRLLRFLKSYSMREAARGYVYGFGFHLPTNGDLFLLKETLTDLAMRSIGWAHNYVPGQEGYSRNFLNNLADIIDEKLEGTYGGVARVPR